MPEISPKTIRPLRTEALAQPDGKLRSSWRHAEDHLVLGKQKNGLICAPQDPLLGKDENLLGG